MLNIENTSLISPTEKLDSFFLKLYSLQEVMGVDVSLIVLLGYEKQYEYFEFISQREYMFFMETLKTKGLIKYVWSGMAYFDSFSITFDGFVYAHDLQKSGSNSNLCFVAMSFDKTEDYLFNDAIEPACTATGYEAKRIDKEHLDAHQTINDGIIATLNRSKFCISDFTKQKLGVYFEAGYALGRGMKVIYTCRSDHFKDSHFDTKHFQHIIYSDPLELKEALTDKINAWINV